MSEDFLELSEEGKRNCLESIHRTWIEPEIIKRRAEGNLPDDFNIRQCLIRLPLNSNPIVDFNMEIAWEFKVKLPEETEFIVGNPVHLHEIESLDSVAPPVCGGTQIAFFFLYWASTGFRLLFDATPNHKHFVPVSADEEWGHSKVICDYYTGVLKERSLHICPEVKQAVERIGLWSAPALLPFPFSSICESCRNKNEDQARQQLVAYCDTDFLTQLVNRWDTIPAFVDRSELFADALQSHKQHRYALCVSALVPHIEGVMTDWLYAQVEASEIPWRMESKTKLFRDLLSQGAHLTYENDSVAQQVTDFIVDGPVLTTFQEWLSPIATHFPNRHVIGHGKFDKAVFTEESSIKVFLMLDTLHRITKAQAAGLPEG